MLWHRQQLRGSIQRGKDPGASPLPATPVPVPPLVIRGDLDLMGDDDDDECLMGDDDDDECLMGDDEEDRGLEADAELGEHRPAISRAA